MRSQDEVERRTLEGLSKVHTQQLLMAGNGHVIGSAVPPFIYTATSGFAVVDR